MINEKISRARLADYERYIKAAGPHSRLGKFYRRIADRIRTEDELESSEWARFLDSLPDARISQINIPEDLQELFFKFANRFIFTQFKGLAEQAALKGEPHLFGTEQPEFYSADFIDQGESGDEYNSITVFSYTRPKPLMVGDDKLGDVNARIFLNNGSLAVSFYLLEDNQVAFGNDYQENTARVIDSAKRLFDTVPAHILYPVGSPADWVGFIYQHKLLDQLNGKLESMPLLSDNPGAIRKL